VATNGNRTDTGSINLCVYDYANGEYCGTCDDGIQNDDETGVDTGGHCGTCYDGIKQDFELIDVDYGGICGNCTGDKKTDTYWSLGRSIDGSIPFNYDYCGEATDGIIGIIQVIAVLVLGALFIFILVSLGILGVLFSFITGSIGVLLSGAFRIITTRKKEKKFK